jgi:hypothetical protein
LRARSASSSSVSLPSGDVVIRDAHEVVGRVAP